MYDSEGVPEEYKAADVCGCGIAWDGIYFDDFWRPPPYLEITILPRFHIGVLVDIYNLGCGPGYDVEWAIRLDHGIILRGRQTSGAIEKISMDEKVRVRSKGVFGFGNVNITVTAEPAYGIGDEKNANGFVFGPFVFIKDN